MYARIVYVWWPASSVHGEQEFLYPPIYNEKARRYELPLCKCKVQNVFRIHGTSEKKSCEKYFKFQVILNVHG